MKEEHCRVSDEEAEQEAAVRSQCLDKGSEKALANKGGIGGMEQGMARESGMEKALANEGDIGGREQEMRRESGMEKALANEGDIGGMEQGMARESGMENDPRTKRASKAVVGEGRVADSGSLKSPAVCRRGLSDSLPGWGRLAAHTPGMAFCTESSLSVARGQSRLRSRCG